MRKRLAWSVLLTACLALFWACGFPLSGGNTTGNKTGNTTGNTTGNVENPSQYQVAFAVNDGSSTRSYTWPAKYQNLGFYYDSYYGHYYNIFCAADGDVGEIYTKKHVYVYLPNGAAGSYSSSDGLTALVYHDALGNRYGVDAYDSNTYLDVVVTVDDRGFLYGSFSGVLSSPNASYAGYYVSISGTIFSYFEGGRAL